MEKTIDEMIKEDCDRAIDNAIVSRAERVLDYLDQQLYLFEHNFKIKWGGVSKTGPEAILNDETQKNFL